MTDENPTFKFLQLMIRDYKELVIVKPLKYTLKIIRIFLWRFIMKIASLCFVRNLEDMYLDVTVEQQDTKRVVCSLNSTSWDFSWKAFVSRAFWNFFCFYATCNQKFSQNSQDAFLSQSIKVLWHFEFLTDFKILNF